MREIVRQTRSHLMEVFEKHGFHPRHDLGQNFLIDLNLIDFIVKDADVGPEDVVLEVGAGTGSLSSFLSIRAAAVVSIEIDPNMYALALENTAGYPNITLLNCDILKNKNNLAPEVLDLLRSKLAEVPGRQLKLVANLPYCVATPVISNLVASDLPWSAIVVTIQWELGDKMRAQPGDGDYGALAVWLQSQARVKVIKKLGPMVFWPRPKVDSAVVKLLADRKAAAKITNREFFHDFLRRLFSHRRKFLRSVLVGMFSQDFTKPEIDALLQPFEFPEGVRADTLEVKTLVKLSNEFYRAVEAKQSVITTPEGSPPASDPEPSNP